MATTVHEQAASIDRTGLPLILRLRPVLDLSDDELFALCQLNRELRIERNARGELLIMPPTGYATGERNNEINRQLGNWAKQDGTGATFDSSTGFRLPNGATRSPDGGWIRRERLSALSAGDRQQFLPLCPDFVIELRSPTDSLRDVQDKLEEYLTNGAQLGWLFDPEPRHVYVYRPEAPVERLEDPDTISGEPLLPGFVLDVHEVW